MELRDTQQNGKKSFFGKEGVVKFLASIGLIIVLILLAVGAVLTVRYSAHIVTRIGAATVSLFSSRDAERIIGTSSLLEVPENKEFILSWNHKEKAINGSYSLYYPCLYDLYLSINTPESGKKVALCNKEFDFINRNDQLLLTALSTYQGDMDLPVTISFTPNGESKPSITGIINLRITPSDNSGVKVSTNDDSVKETVKTVYVPVYQNTSSQNQNINVAVSNPNGKADLTPSLIGTGVLDSSNNFTLGGTLSRANFKNAIRFRVQNLGDKTSLPFRFNAYLPAYPNQVYNSDEQPGIAPGGSTEFTLGFDQATQGQGTIRIVLDPSNNIAESNESNNELQTSVFIQ